MMKGMHNQMRMQAAALAAARASVLIGKVLSFDPNRYVAKVSIEPEGTESGWMPVASAWTGNQWGLFMPPSPGDLVLIYCPDGELKAGIVGPSIYSNVNKPLAVNSGELWMVHASGSLIKLLADGSITVTTKSGKAVNVTGDVNVTGKVTATGDIKSSAGNVADQTGTIAAMRSTYNSHTHTDPQGGVSGPATPAM